MKKSLLKSSTTKATASSEDEAGSLGAFFDAARIVARAIDAGEAFGGERVLRMGALEDVAKALTPQRLRIVKSISNHPKTMSHLVTRLRRERSAIMRDLKILKSYGLLEVTEVANPGHGKMLEVRKMADRIAVEVVL